MTRYPWQRQRSATVQDTDPEELSDQEAEQHSEARWPMAGAVLCVITLTALLPGSLRFGPPWLLPLGEGLLLVAVAAADPGRITRRSQLLRRMSIGLVAVVALGALQSAVKLIDELISGGSLTNEAGALLEAGATVWLTNNLAFALLFWELDCGGSAARAHRLPLHPDFAFPQQLNPDIAPPHWRPRFVDYLYLALTNSLAFSPTDAMPLAAWTKIGMGTQALISFSIVGLVIARAVNVFG
jgi:hypothetical protein